MDNKLINKVCGFILNLRHLGFNAASWADLQAGIGELSPSDKAALTRALESAGATYRGKNWVFVDLDLGTLRATPVTTPAVPVKLVKITVKVEAGCWGFDENGKFRFVPDPLYIFPTDDTDPDNETDEDDDVSALADPAPRGKLQNLGL